jgi:hypothetical protein
MNIEEKEYIVFWRNGDVETIKGVSIPEAFRGAGYAGSSVESVDFFGNKKDLDNYTYVSGIGWQRN